MSRIRRDEPTDVETIATVEARAAQMSGPLAGWPGARAEQDRSA